MGQPFENFDAMDSFMRAAEDQEGEDTVQAYLESLPVGHYWSNAEFDRFYGTWVTALYTRQFNPSSLSALYYYRDEQENLPSSLQRRREIENCAYSVALNSYSPEAIAANSSRFYNDANSNTWNRQLQPWRSCYFSFMPSNALFFLVWVDGKTGQRNYYATVSSRGADVQTIDYALAEDFRRVYYGRSLSEVGVVVASLDAMADYDLMVWGLSEFSLNIVYIRAQMRRK